MYTVLAQLRRQLKALGWTGLYAQPASFALFDVNGNFAARLTCHTHLAGVARNTEISASHVRKHSGARVLLNGRGLALRSPKGFDSRSGTDKKGLRDNCLPCVPDFVTRPRSPYASITAASLLEIINATLARRYDS